MTLIAVHYLFFQTVFTKEDRAGIKPDIQKLLNPLIKAYVNYPNKDVETFQKRINLMSHQVYTNGTFKCMEQ